MAVPYIVVQRKNPQKPSEPKKYYAQARSSGEISYRQLAVEIAAKSSLNAGDVYNVLEVLGQVMNRELSEGRIVRLGDFGSLMITLSSSGAETEEKFTSSLITEGRISFRPGINLQYILNNLQFKRVSSAAGQLSQPSTGTGTKPQQPTPGGGDQQQQPTGGNAGQQQPSQQGGGGQPQQPSQGGGQQQQPTGGNAGQSQQSPQGGDSQPQQPTTDSNGV